MVSVQVRDVDIHLNGENEMKKMLMMTVIAMTLTGCLSSAYHFGGENDYPYNATSDCCVSCLGVWGHEPKTDVENAMDAYTKLVYPFWIVDFPLEVVFDTAFLPFDTILMCCEDEKESEKK